MEERISVHYNTEEEWNAVKEYLGEVIDGMDFKVGDRVVCTNGADVGKFGKVFTVKYRDNEGLEFDEITGAYHKDCFKLATKNKTIKETKDMKDSEDVRKEFGKEEGNTYMNILNHMNDDVMNRILRKRFHKEIVTACNLIEAEKIAEAD